MRPVDTQELLTILAEALTLPTLVPASAAQEVPLLFQGRHLAHLYRQATTKHGARSRLPRAVVDGQPMAMVILADGEWVRPLDPASGLTMVDRDSVGGATLGFARVAVRNTAVPTWFLGPGHSKALQLRALRTSLFRLHAEREALDGILKQLRRGTITYLPRSDAGDRLEDYLNTATRLVSREHWMGHSSAAIQQAFDASESAERPVDFLDLSERLAGARRQVALKVRRYVLTKSSRRVYSTIQIGGTVMDNRINISRSTVFDTNILQGRMDNVLNTLSQSSANDELKRAINTLADEVTQLVGALNDERVAEETTARFELIVSQAQRPHPLADAVRSAAEGLVRVAETVGHLAAPVAAAVKAVLDALRISS